MGWLEKYQNGGNIRKIDSTLNANKHLGWVERLYQKNGENIQLPGVEGTSTHYLSQIDNYAVPLVDTDSISGKLKYTKHPDAKYIQDRGIKFPSDKEALDFTQHYKEGTGVLKEYQDGGIIEDDNGYWNPDNIGKDVMINSNRITMKGYKTTKKVHSQEEADYLERRQELEEKSFTGKNNKLKVTPKYSKKLKKVSLKNGGWLEKYNK